MTATSAVTFMVRAMTGTHIDFFPIGFLSSPRLQTPPPLRNTIGASSPGALALGREHLLSHTFEQRFFQSKNKGFGIPRLRVGMTYLEVLL